MMESSAVINHNTQPAWIMLQRSIFKVPLFRETFLSGIRDMFYMYMGTEARMSYDKAGHQGTINAHYKGWELIYVDSGRLKIIQVDKSGGDHPETELKEAVSFGFFYIAMTIRNLCAEKRARLHGRRTRLQSPFENIPDDVVFSLWESIDIEKGVLTYPDGEQFLSLHIEFKDESLLLDGASVDLGQTNAPRSTAKGSRQSVQVIVDAMRDAAPDLILRKSAAGLLSLSEKSRQFERLWPQAVEQFEAQGIETIRKYRVGGAPTKSPQSKISA